MLKTLIIILFCASIAICQQINVHVAGTGIFTDSLGFENPTLGGTIGTDFRKNKIILSGDLEVLNIKKKVGGKGYQVSGRETFRFYNNSSLFIQFGSVQQHYSVTQFSKSSVQGLVGAGFSYKDINIASANYRHDFTSPNKQRIFEVYDQMYLFHHIYLAPSIAIASVNTNGVRSFGSTLRFSVGFHF